jgi:O-antigen ligase
MSVVTPTLFTAIINLFSGVSNDPSVESRTGSYDLAGYFIDRKPLFGRGLGTFLPKYRIFDNQYLGLLVSIGLVGTAAFIALGLVGLAVLARVRRTVRCDDATRDLATALMAATIVGFVSLFEFDAFAFPMSLGTIFLTLGLAGTLRRVTRQDPVGDTPPW